MKLACTLGNKLEDWFWFKDGTDLFKFMLRSLEVTSFSLTPRHNTIFTLLNLMLSNGWFLVLNNSNFNFKWIKNKSTSRPENCFMPRRHLCGIFQPLQHCLFIKNLRCQIHFLSWWQLQLPWRNCSRISRKMNGYYACHTCGHLVQPHNLSFLIGKVKIKFPQLGSKYHNVTIHLLINYIWEK